jgi:hypothetical protein
MDDMTLDGFIGLQVHSIGGNNDLAGKKVCWKNISIITTDLNTSATKPDLSVPQVNNIPNSISPTEKAQGWRLLWDGKTTAGWRGAKLDGFPEKGWKIEDGQLIVLASNGVASARGGDIVTVDSYGNFELEVDFKLAKGANSGIKYFVDAGPDKRGGDIVGCEFQLIDEEHNKDAKGGAAGNHSLGSLYDLIAPESPHGKPFNADGWNKARIVVKGAHVEHWLNNVKVVEYERGTEAWRALVARSKFKGFPGFGEAERGHILLQEHNDEAHFRSIKIRE